MLRNNGIAGLSNIGNMSIPSNDNEATGSKNTIFSFQDTLGPYNLKIGAIQCPEKCQSLILPNVTINTYLSDNVPSIQHNDELSNFAMPQNTPFVIMSAELLAFLLLYRVSLEHLITYFLLRKKSTKDENNISCKSTFIELIDLGLLFFEKEKTFCNTEKKSRRVLKKKERKKAYAKIYYKHKQNIPVSVQSSALLQPEYKVSGLPLPLVIFNKKYVPFFRNLKNKCSYYNVFITLMSLLYKTTTYYNEHLNDNFQCFLAHPPFLCYDSVGYCLDNLRTKNLKNFLAYWVIDWLVHFISLKTKKTPYPSFPNDLQPDSYITSFMVVMFCAVHNNSQLNSLVQNTVFFSTWLKEYTHLACNDKGNATTISNFIKRAIGYCDINLLKHRFVKRQINLINLSTQPDFNLICCDVSEFFLFCHKIIHEALLKTINNN